MKYPIYFQSTTTQNFNVVVPDLPGCEAQSKTIDEGFEIIKIAIADHLKILAEYGEKIPIAKSVMEHQRHYLGVIWAVTDIDISPYLGKSHKINVTLPELLIKQIDDRVSKSEEHKTRSGFIAQACLNELNNQRNN